ncbi:unnamed protein product [Pleuronectes platessa]|uniref:Uncharacterized protein n=1 Tax=Pleuronectes platessa TaxID=8262 RepID=A0A9N7VHK2_PLEPL|nr:unnamed protein product [Pleuronectes platessa]
MEPLRVVVTRSNSGCTQRSLRSSGSSVIHTLIHLRGEGSGSLALSPEQVGRGCVGGGEHPVSAGEQKHLEEAEDKARLRRCDWLIVIRTSESQASEWQSLVGGSV